MCIRDRHGGVIDFENLGRGTVFRFTLPLAPTRQPSEASTKP